MVTHMHTSSAGIDLIKQFEGFRSEAYLCAGGKWTVGYGSTEGVQPGMIITEAEAEARLKHDLQTAEHAVSRLVTRSLTQHQFDALASFTFNLGSGALQRSTLRQKVNRMEDDAVPQEFCRWVYSGGRKLRGLIRRREAEAVLYALPEAIRTHAPAA